MRRPESGASRERRPCSSAKPGPAKTAIATADADGRRGPRPRPRRRPHGPPDLHRVLLLPHDREGAERRPALLPRPAAGHHRRARPDADGGRRAHDARRRAGRASGRRRRRHSRRRHRRPRHGRTLRQGAGRRRRRVDDRRQTRRGRGRNRRARFTPAARRCPASAIPCTSRSTRAPIAFLRSPPSGKLPARAIDLAPPLHAGGRRKSGGGRCR